jgi:hypothetical protein
VRVLMVPVCNRIRDCYLSQKEGCCLESFFRCALVLASDQQGGFVLFMGIRVPGKTPAVFVPEVANPAEVNRGIPQPFNPLIACLTGRWTASPRHVGFRVCVDITESTSEADVDSSDFSE